MKFKESKAIYLQIADRLSAEILQGKYPVGERVPSVREYAAEVEVNVNTMMRSFEYLQQNDIIYNKRGVGYFVAEDAKSIIYRLQKDKFLQDDLIDFFEQVQLLDIPMYQIVEKYEAYIKGSHKSEKE